jgi:hypothetical protein
VGNSIFGIATRLNEKMARPGGARGIPKDVSGDFDNANGAPYTPLEFGMVSFRVSPLNGGSTGDHRHARLILLRRLTLRAVWRAYERHSYEYAPTPRRVSIRGFERTWQSSRSAISVPTSADIDEAKCKQIGLPRCPFEITTFPQRRRKTGITSQRLRQSCLCD